MDKLVKAAAFDKVLRDSYSTGRPKEWRNHVFAVPRKCVFCKETLWGKGRIGYVQWPYDNDVWRAHTECQTMEVLSGNN